MEKINTDNTHQIEILKASHKPANSFRVTKISIIELRM